MWNYGGLRQRKIKSADYLHLQTSHKKPALNILEAFLFNFLFLLFLVSNEKYAKLRNYFSKMKKLNQILLQKRLCASIGYLCLTNWHLNNLEGQVEIEITY